MSSDKTSTLLANYVANCKKIQNMSIIRKVPVELGISIALCPEFL